MEFYRFRISRHSSSLIEAGISADARRSYEGGKTIAP
jgi:hypothetical protein